ncbi:MAG: signal transduction histidine kinase [Candidatus Endobugula sp.]
MFINKLSSLFTKSHSIGKSLLLWIVFFSSLTTVFLSGIQLFIDYNVEVKTINGRLDEIENSYKASIAASLWNVDREQLSIQVEGIKRLPDINAIVIKESQNVENAIYIEEGVLSDFNTDLRREYSLNKLEGGEKIHIGDLYIEASLTAVYQRLLNKALTILLVQGIKTFFVSFFILYIFYRLVTRHIVGIEKFLRNKDMRSSFSELTLSRKKVRKSADELDHLVNAYNSMITDLRCSYDDIRTVNLQLKKDIVVRKQAQADVKLLNDELEKRVSLRTAELEAANKELNSFCYSVSHDLKAPLRRVEGFRRNFTQEFGASLDPKGAHYLSRMEACTTEMRAMIDSFLILSKSTNAELMIDDVNLSAIAARVTTRLQERDESKQVLITIQKNIFVQCDARMVELLMTNLLDNAWKYSSKTTAPVISFYRRKKNGEYIYVVDDNGAGFNMEFAENLFSPFTRLHKVSDFQGIGIGLATVKRVAARHGGRVWAESTIGEGAKFYFTLCPPKLKLSDIARNEE